jgi:hypothetical protein
MVVGHRNEEGCSKKDYGKIYRAILPALPKGRRKAFLEG